VRLKPRQREARGVAGGGAPGAHSGHGTAWPRDASPHSTVVAYSRHCVEPGHRHAGRCVHGFQSGGGWTYSFWDAERAEPWIAETYGREVLDLYLRIRPEYYAARSDLLRYLNMYAMGGVYLDIKSTCDRPLDEAILPEDRYIVTPWDPDERDGRYHPEVAHVATGESVQWVLASTRGHPIMRAVIRQVLSNIDRYSEWRFSTGGIGTLRTTGPIAYTIGAEAHRAGHAHTLLNSPRERGFRYTALDQDIAHRSVFGTHYTGIKTAVVTPSLVQAIVLGTVRRIKRLPFGAAAMRKLRSVLVKDAEC
jgi:inositol phosphorylceramide mannosyltransferase catalytic subunit